MPSSNEMWRLLLEGTQVEREIKKSEFCVIYICFVFQLGFTNIILARPDANATHDCLNPLRITNNKSRLSISPKAKMQ